MYKIGYKLLVALQIHEKLQPGADLENFMTVAHRAWSSKGILRLFAVGLLKIVKINYIC